MKKDLTYVLFPKNRDQSLKVKFERDPDCNNQTKLFVMLIQTERKYDLFKDKSNKQNI